MISKIDSKPFKVKFPIGISKTNKIDMKYQDQWQTVYGLIGEPNGVYAKYVYGIDVPFEDRQNILYVNASYKSDDDIGRLMHDFLCSDPDDMYTEILADKARYLETDPKGVDIMCKMMEDLRAESIQRGIDQSRVESIKNLMQTLKLTAQQAMDALMIPASEQPKYAAKL